MCEHVSPLRSLAVGEAAAIPPLLLNEAIWTHTQSSGRNKPQANTLPSSLTQGRMGLEA